jgi:thermostable 8-oxoguanine DNA glycosylase
MTDQLSQRIEQLKASGKSGIEIYEQLVKEGVEEKIHSHIEFVISTTQTTVMFAYLEALLCLGWGLELSAAKAIVQQAQSMCNTGDEIGSFKGICSTAMRLANSLVN